MYYLEGSLGWFSGWWNPSIKANVSISCFYKWECNHNMFLAFNFSKMDCTRFLQALGMFSITCIFFFFYFCAEKEKLIFKCQRIFMRNSSGHARNCFRLPDPKSIAMWACLREECISSDAAPQRAGMHSFSGTQTPLNQQTVYCRKQCSREKDGYFPKKAS